MTRNVQRRVFAALLTLLLTQSAFAQRTLGISDVQLGSDFREQIGKRLTFVCPATDGAKAVVYGTGTYADFSSICAAAIHAGFLRAGQAGAISILMGSEVGSFVGSTKNDITSKGYGRWGYSFTFVREGEPGAIGWRTTWSLVPKGFEDSVLLACPGGGRPDGAVWGTDVYTNDSSICAAAVHAGVISTDGGLVSARRAQALRQYPGSERNGVASKAWGSAADAFSVAPPSGGGMRTAVRGSQALAPAPSTPPPAASAPPPGSSPLENATVVSITPLPALATPAVSSGTTTGASSTSGATPAPATAPRIVQVTPSSGVPGTTFGVTINASGTHFGAGTTASFGSGVTLLSLTVNGSTMVTATVRIEASAAPGMRRVSVSSGTEVVSADGLLVVGVTPDAFGKSCDAATQYAPLAAGTQVVRDGVLHAAGVQDWFRVPIPQGTQLVLTIRNVASFGSVFGIRVFGDCGSPALSTTSPGMGSLVVPDREPHTALVAVFAHTWIQATPNFRLTVEAVPVFQPDTTPNPLQFVTKNLAAPFVSYESNAVTISGINVPVPISIDGNAEYSINGRAYTSLPGTVSNGETVRLRMTLNAGQIERRTTLSAGSVTASWRMTIAP